jgi:hypothetical protein
VSLAELAAPIDALRIEEVDPTAGGRWDDYVASHDDGLVYHHSDWLRVLRRENGQTPFGLALLDDAGAVHGVLPLMNTRGLPLPGFAGIAGRRLASLPRTPVAGPIADDRDGLAALVHAAAARTPPGTQLQIKPAHADLYGVAGLVGHPWRLTYVLELPPDPDDLHFGSARNHAKISGAVAKARREGVRVRAGETVADLRAWYALYLETMRHHFVPARPFRLFRAMWEEMRPRGTMRLLLAEHDGGLVAGSVYLELGSTVFHAFAGSQRTSLGARPNEFLHWEAIHTASARGFRWYDFGEVVEEHAGLARFKAKWGSEAQRLHRYYLPPPGSAPNPGDPQYGPTGRALTRAWKRLPLRATALAGDATYRLL